MISKILHQRLNQKLIDKGELKLEETRTIVLDIYDYKLIINALNEFRNKKIAENVDTEIIDELIKKLLDAPVDKRKVKGNFAFER